MKFLKIFDTPKLKAFDSPYLFFESEIGTENYSLNKVSITLY